MPILIEDAEFIDFNGDSLTYYQSNAGDKVTAVVNIRSTILLSSIGNSLIFDYTQNTVSSTTTSWLEEGFRVGDWVRIRHYTASASIIDSWWTQINYVDDFNCDFDTLNNLTLNISNGETISFLAVTGNGNVEARSRDTLDLLLNHSVNNNSGAPESLIDGEVTRSVFPNVGSMAVSDVINSDIVGNQSGQFLVSSSITRKATPFDGWLRHEITLVFSNSGAYDQSWFTSSNCLKLFLKLMWASVASEPFARTEAVYNFDSNTGWFDQAHNTSIANSSLVSGIDEISYCNGMPGLSVTVDGPTTDLGIGFMYIPIDTSYYKNQIYSQQDLTMLRPTSPLAIGILGSETNPLGAACGINVTNITTIGSQTTIEFDFGGNTEFNSFMASRNSDDRLFRIWVKCGNSNILVFNDQLTCEPVTFTTLPMIQDYGYLDHSENVTSAVFDSTGFIADTEDDVAFVGSFLLEKLEEFSSFSVKIEAFNDITLQDFTLQEAFFSFNGVQISNDGRYLLSEQVASVTTLPNTSEKRLIILELDPSLDVGTQYGVKIYAPWLLNWKYWEPKTNVSVDFYPNQNENWQQYDGGVADWTIRTELILQQGILGYHHSNKIRVRDYDAEALIVSEIEMIRELDGSIVNVVPAGELMRIRGTHTKLSGVWDPLETWGMLTVEPFEGSPRWISSSVVPFDNNSFNPLTPESGSVITITFPTPDVAVLECIFDSSKIDLSNGISVTAKIKDPRNGSDPDLPSSYEERIKKKYESVKLPESFGEQDRGFEKCCEKVLVLASPDSETWKNDVTSAWIKLANPSDTFTFELRKDGVATTTYTLTSNQFVNQSNAYYTTVQWKEVLSLEGIGCYQIVIVWNIGGISSETIWRNTTYQLKAYSIDEALCTARIRSVFNLNQMIEGIDFTDSKVEDSIRFNGQIRKDQPNTKQRNVTYNNRRIEPIISEKSQTYIIETDGYTDPMLKLLEELFLLSSNEMFISDYNAHTNDYGILDTEVTMLEDESPEREPIDRFARQEVLTCVVGNRFRNERTHY